MNAYQREDRITELQIGNIVSDINEACSPNNFNLRPTNFITLTSMLSRHFLGIANNDCFIFFP